MIFEINENWKTEQDYIDALLKIHNMTRKERKDIGAKARENVLKNFSFDQYGTSWDRVLQGVHDKHGSWETRKNYNHWTLKGI
jgi:hypothetical protein